MSHKSLLSYISVFKSHIYVHVHLFLLRGYALIVVSLVSLLNVSYSIVILFRVISILFKLNASSNVLIDTYPIVFLLTSNDSKLVGNHLVGNFVN